MQLLAPAAQADDKDAEHSTWSDAIVSSASQEVYSPIEVAKLLAAGDE